MRVSVREAVKRGTLSIRIKPEVRGLIDRAAELVGKNRTDFVLDAARRASQVGGGSARHQPLKT